MKFGRSKNWNKRFHEFLKKTTIVLSVFVVFLSSYLLVLPAVTLDGNTGESEPGIDIDTMPETVEISGDTEDKDKVYVVEDDVQLSSVSDEGDDTVINEGVVVSGIEEDEDNVSDTEINDNTVSQNVPIDNNAEEPSKQNDGTSFEMPPLSFEVSLNDTLIFISSPEGALPSDTSVKVKEITDDKDIIDTISSSIQEGKTISKVKAYDISFIRNEEEIEPKLPVQVSITSTFMQEEDDDALLFHMKEEESPEQMKTKTLNEEELSSYSEDHIDSIEEHETIEQIDNNNTVFFESDSFSVYAIVYTVDFAYNVNGKEYAFSMQGADSVSLRALIEALHVYELAENESYDIGSQIEKEVAYNDLVDINNDNNTLDSFMTDIDSVAFSDPELLAVCKIEENTTLGDLNIKNGILQEWTLTAHESEVKRRNNKQFLAGDWALISLCPFDTEECLKIKLKTGEEFTIYVTDEQDAQMVGDQVLTVSNPAGTTIDLFDYWIDDEHRYTVGRAAWPGGFNGGGWTNDWLYQDINLQVEGQGTEAGINKGHSFKFSPAWAGTVRDGTTNNSNQDASGRVNSYTGDEYTWHWDCPNPQLGIVQSTLDSGYPVLTDSDSLGTDGESLAYLFDPTISHIGKESYSGVDQFLYVDKDGYYKYDSRDYKANYNYDGTFTLTEQTASGSDRGFWPFGTSTYWSGMHINAQFSMPQNGKVLNPRGEYKDMQFEFSGDDDTWIYVDGVLIGDGGGIHNRCEIDINFANGNVILNGEVVGTLKDIIESAKREEIENFTPKELEEWNAQWDGNTFAAGTYHTFDMFYLERGGDQSNLYIRYNLVSTADFTAHKSYSGYDGEDVLLRNQFRFELIGLDGKYRSVWDENAHDYVIVQEDSTSEAIMPHASSSGSGTTVSPYYSDDYSVELSNGTTANSQIYITGNVEDGNVNFGNAQISEQDMHDCDEKNPPVYRYIVREAVPDDAVNSDNITWANATPEQKAAGGFVKDSIVYDNTVYYMLARVTSWTETDAGGVERTRYGLNKTYYTDDTYTTKKENTPFIDFRNRYQADLADFEFDKVDANEEPVDGAVFQLFRDSACKIPAKDSNNQPIIATSDSEGKVSFENVRTGIYFMKEISAPDPYDLNLTVYRVTFSKQRSYMSVNSDQNNTPVTEVFNLKPSDITVNKKWVNESGKEVSGEGHPATVQLRRYRYVSTADVPETHTVTLHFHFPEASWNTPHKDFGPYTVTGHSVNIHWKVDGCEFFWDSAYTQKISDGDSLIQIPLTDDIELDIYGNKDWASGNLNNVSIDGAIDDSKELCQDEGFPSASDLPKATQTLTNEHPMHAWSFGIGDEFDFPPGDELGQYLYYVVELDEQGQEVTIGNNVDDDMKLLSITYEPEKTEGKGITHGLITVTNELKTQTPVTVDITIIKADNDDTSIKLGGAIFTLTKVQSLESLTPVSEGGYSGSGTTSSIDGEMKGKLSFTGLTSGYYYLSETKCPDGYITTTNGWHFQVDENGIVNGAGDFEPDGFFRYVDENSIMVTNQKGTALPSTGGPGIGIFTIFGTLLIFTAGMLLLKRQKWLLDNLNVN